MIYFFEIQKSNFSFYSFTFKIQTVKLTQWLTARFTKSLDKPKVGGSIPVWGICFLFIFLQVVQVVWYYDALRVPVLYFLFCCYLISIGINSRMDRNLFLYF